MDIFGLDNFNFFPFYIWIPKPNLAFQLTSLTNVVFFQLGLENGDSEPNTWIFLQQMTKRNVTAATSELVNQVKLMDRVFEDYHGPGTNLRYGTNAMTATENFILSKDSTKHILPRIVKLFVKIKLHHRLKALKSKGTQKSSLRSITKKAHNQF